MRIVGTDVGAAVAGQFLKADPDIGLDVLHQVTDMNRAVRVGQGTGDEQLAVHDCDRGSRAVGRQWGEGRAGDCNERVPVRRRPAVSEAGFELHVIAEKNKRADSTQESNSFCRLALPSIRHACNHPPVE